MKRLFFSVIFLSVFLSFSYGDTIILKSGNVIEGDILKQTDDYIKVELENVPLTYYMGDVYSINGTAVNIPKVDLSEKENTVLKEEPVILAEEKDDLSDAAVKEGLFSNKDLKENLNLDVYDDSFDTAVIKYEYSGARSGTETVYIDLQSNNIAVYTTVTTTLKGVTDTDETLALYDGKTAYKVNFGRNMAVKTVVTSKDIIADFFSEARYIESPCREGVILGKKCTIYSGPAGEVYFWKGIPLKEDLSIPMLGAKYIKEASSIDLDITVNRELFKLPKNVKVVDAKDLMKQFRKIKR